MTFKKTSHFTSSPYCVVVQAREILRKKVHVENSTVCIFSDVTSVPGLKTKPSKRHDDRSTKRSSMKMYTETIPAASTPSDIIIKKESVVLSASLIKKDPVNIEFPSEVVVLQNASFLARVTKPLDPLNDTKIK